MPAHIVRMGRRYVGLQLRDGRIVWLGWWDRILLRMGWTTVRALEIKHSRRGRRA